MSSAFRLKSSAGKFRDSDAVFTGAMNVQRDSLVGLLKGPARGTDTPWVLGGPLASTYRSSIMDPRERDGCGCCIKGSTTWSGARASPWIAELNRRLEETPKHRAESPFLFIPERVLNAPEASRKYLQDRSIFEPFDGLPSPRWDLIEVGHYRALMLQTTAGCRFRCNFCDIIQFNGGFPGRRGAAMSRENCKPSMTPVFGVGCSRLTIISCPNPRPWKRSWTR